MDIALPHPKEKKIYKEIRALFATFLKQYHCEMFKQI